MIKFVKREGLIMAVRMNITLRIGNWKQYPPFIIKSVGKNFKLGRVIKNIGTKIKLDFLLKSIRTK